MSILSRALSSRRRKFNVPPDRNRRVQRPSISNSSTENRMDHEEIPTASSPPVNDQTNFDRFLECTTPLVRAQHLPKTIIGSPPDRTIEIEHPPYFVLEDLWDSLDESSCVAVPLVVYGTDSVRYSVIQYYEAHFSGIQLYTHPKRPSTIRKPDGSNNAVQVARSGTEIADENITRLTRLSLVNRPFRDWSGVETKPLGHLVYEKFENDKPSTRGPLLDRMKELASEFPALMTYRSCDLSPSSWISVFWLPICRDPEGPHLPLMDTCFLTYHCLSTQLPGTRTDGPPFRGFDVGDFQGAEMPSNLPLYISGLAFFKLRASLWITPEAIESPKANSLFQEAKNWLTRLRVRHPDFVVFAARSYLKDPIA